MNGSLDQALAAAVRAELRRAISEELVPAIREVLNEASPAPLLVDRQTAAEMLAVSLPTLDAWIAAGNIYTIANGRRKLIPVAALEQFAAVPEFTVALAPAGAPADVAELLRRVS